MNECDIIYSIVIGVFTGIISSLIAWVLLNILLIPQVQIDDEIQYGRQKNYLRIYNKSRLDVFEVVCYLEYKHHDGSSFFRTTDPLPNLKRKTGKHAITLGRNVSSSLSSKSISKTDTFFMQDNGIITVTITYQNRFGVKRTLKPKNINYTKESPESIA